MYRKCTCSALITFKVSAERKSYFALKNILKTEKQKD